MPIYRKCLKTVSLNRMSYSRLGYPNKYAVFNLKFVSSVSMAYACVNVTGRLVIDVILDVYEIRSVCVPLYSRVLKF